MGAGIVNDKKALMTCEKGSAVWDSLNLDTFLDCFHKDERKRERRAHLKALGLPSDSAFKTIWSTLKQRKLTDYPDKPSGSDPKWKLLQPIIVFFEAEKQRKVKVLFSLDGLSL